MTVFAVKDPAGMATQFEKSAGAVGACSKFTVELQGQKITSEMKPLEAAVQADKSLSALTVQTLPAGQKQAMVTVTGVNGTTADSAPNWSSSSTRPSPQAERSRFMDHPQKFLIKS